MAAFFRRLPRMDAGSLAKDPLARIYFLQRSRCLSFGRLLAPCRHPVFSTVYTGDTVTAYLTKAKMDFACSLLLTTQMTTIEIACQLGYSSLSHFNKCFRNHTGKSPREYRRAAGSQGR